MPICSLTSRLNEVNRNGQAQYWVGGGEQGRAWGGWVEGASKSQLIERKHWRVWDDTGGACISISGSHQPSHDAGG